LTNTIRLQQALEKKWRGGHVVARDHGAKPQRLDAVAPFDNSGIRRSLCHRLNAEAAGARSALNRTRQKRIGRRIPVRRLKLLLGPCLNMP